MKILCKVVSACRSAYAKHGTALPDAVFDSIRKNKVALKCPVGAPVDEGICRGDKSGDRPTVTMARLH